MSRIDVFDTTGKKISQAELSDAIFNVTVNPTLVHQAVTCQLANQRQSTAHTKTRGEVSGGGRKPWRQKGTGRARAGSSRSPIWVGGGITFGPRSDRNYDQLLNRKMRRKALFMALTAKAKDNHLIIVNELKLTAPKTRAMAEILTKLPTRDGSTLLVLPQNDMIIEVSAANLPNVKTIHLSSLNLLDTLKYDYLLMTEAGLQALENHFVKPTSPASAATTKKATNNQGEES